MTDSLSWTLGEQALQFVLFGQARFVTLPATLLVMAAEPPDAQTTELPFEADQAEGASVSKMGKASGARSLFPVFSAATPERASMPSAYTQASSNRGIVFIHAFFGNMVASGLVPASGDRRR